MPLRVPALVLLCLILVSGIAAAQDGQLTIDYSFPWVGDSIPPAPDIVEGAIVATFRAEEPIWLLVEDDTTLVRVDESTFAYTFPWNWTEEKLALFTTADDSVLHAYAEPRRVLPFGQQTHTLPIVHIRTDSTFLWDPAVGIYVYGDYANFTQRGEEWERLAYFELMTAAGSTVVGESVGMRIHGSWSRRFEQKSLRLYFDDYGSADEVEYDFFGDGPTSVRRLLLRTHLFPFSCVNADVLDRIFLDLGHLGARSTPVVGYINSESWGLYALRERIDDEFVEHTHDLAGGSFGDYVLIKDTEPEHGNAALWDDLVAEFALGNDFASHAWYTGISDRLDLASYIDFHLLNIYAASSDAGFGYNMAELKVGEEPWRILTVDQDDTFFIENINSDFFRFFAAADQAELEAYWPPLCYFETTDPVMLQWSTMLNRLLQNSQFKARFFARVDELLDGELSAASLQGRFNDLLALQEPEVPQHAFRWDWPDTSDLATHVADLGAWVTTRTPIVRQQAADLFEHFRVPVELVDFDAMDTGGAVNLKWQTGGETGNLGFVVYRATGTPDSWQLLASYTTEAELVGAPDTDEVVFYQYTDEAPVIGEANFYRLEYVPDGGSATELSWIESAWVVDWSGLVVNELMASNTSTVADTSGQYGDWFEIYNGTPTTVCLDSLFVTDDPLQPMRHRLDGALTIPSGGHLLMWADRDTVQGPTHCDFKLAEAGEALYLFAPDGATLIDSVSFGEQLADVAWSRFADGDPEWSHSMFPTPGTENVDPGPQTALFLNEILAWNTTTLADEFGEYDSWLEIWNPLPVSLDLDGLELCYSEYGGGCWSLPDSTIGPRKYLVVWLDGQEAQGAFHTSFEIAPLSAETVTLGDSVRGDFDIVAWSGARGDVSNARTPDGSNSWRQVSPPTPGAANPSFGAGTSLVFNEFMAINDTGILDETGAAEDWVEIYNSGAGAISMAGCYLTDNLAAPQTWALPDTVLQAGEFMLVWCDNDPLDGPLHANFKLSGDGEELGLAYVAGATVFVLDSHVFGVQTADVSEGRLVDGTGNWGPMEISTPGESNTDLAPVPPGPPSRLRLSPNYPNPFNPRTTLAFELHARGRVQLTIHDLRGRLVASLIDTDLAAGSHSAIWDGRTGEGESVATGVYLARLRAGGETMTRRMVLVR